jgi:hypothetical protein
MKKIMMPIRRLASIGLVVLSCLAVATPALAADDPDTRPRYLKKTGDALVARPIGLAMTVLGSAVFVVSLPFTALAGGVGESADTLVIGPAKETFYRCLGCVQTGRQGSATRR